MGAVWAAVTAGELLGLPATLLLVLDAALVGSVAGLSSHSTTAILAAIAVPPFTAGLSRGARGVALALSAELAAYVMVVLSTSKLDQVQGSAAFTWAATGLGLGVFFSIVIGCGLMALMFYSSRRGYDEATKQIGHDKSRPGRD